MLYFYAPGSEICQKLNTTIDEIISAYPNTIKKINIDYDPELPYTYKVTSVPTVVVFENENEIGRNSGIQTKDYYLQILKLK
jgi:thioredoxin-like negative regulator of GroEL